MNKITLIATTTFGLEAVVKREVLALGFETSFVTDGRIEFEAEIADIPKANLWLRSADRVLLKIGSFEATTFDELFDQTKALPWEKWITKDGKFTVKGKAINSTLGSYRACQSIVKKAIVENLKEHYHTDWFSETGPEFTAQIAMQNDIALLTIDTSGTGLHKRGYRTEAGEAPLKETLAAALVQLSFWRKDRLLVDPMCGSGTILIEAALLALNIAPGLNRSFASEEWPIIPKSAWQTARQEATNAKILDQDLQIQGSDSDEKVIKVAQQNAKRAGVGDQISFTHKPLVDVFLDQEHGIIITNPPYGMRLSEFQEMNQIYITLHKMLRKKLGWSIYVLTADIKFRDYFKRSRPDKVRKLYNGKIQVNLYQYFGEKPKNS